MEELPITTVVAAAGFAAGMVFGITSHHANFCTMGALSDMVYLGDRRRFRSWLLAIAVAIIGTQTIYALGVVDIYKAIYLTPNFGWFGAIVGGLIFGFGMTMTGGCAGRTLVRMGAGNLKSILVFLVLGIFAYMTLRGLTGLLRIGIEGTLNADLGKVGLESQGMVDMIVAATGVGAGSARWALATLFGGGLLVYCLKDADFRASPRNLVAGVIIGLLIPFGWWITGVLGQDDFEPVALASFTFVAPAGQSIQYLMTFTGTTISFGVATVGGVVLGAFLTALFTRTFRIESFTDRSDMLRHLLGAAMMGFGGVLEIGRASCRERV